MIGGGLALFLGLMVVARRLARGGDQQLGCMSEQWLAEQRQSRLP